MSDISRSPAARRQAMRSIPDEEPEFQIAPMIDILLVLLVFFMSISSTEVLQTNDHVKLPIAKDAKDKDKANGANSGQMIVNVLWDSVRNGGVIEMNEKPYGLPSDIIPEISRNLSSNPAARILVRADKQVRYEYMKQLLKAIGQANGTNVTFSVVDKENTGGAAAPATP